MEYFDRKKEIKTEVRWVRHLFSKVTKNDSSTTNLNKGISIPSESKESTKTIYLFSIRVALLPNFNVFKTEKQHPHIFAKKKLKKQWLHTTTIKP